MWHYTCNGQTFGPISEAELDAQVRSGALPSDVHIWRDGMNEWVPYNSRITSPPSQGAVATQPVNLSSASPVQGSSLRLESASSWVTIAVVFIAMFGFLGALSSRPRIADHPFKSSQITDAESDEFRAGVQLRSGSLNIKNSGGFDWPETRITFQFGGNTYSHEIDGLKRGETTSIPLTSFTAPGGGAYVRKAETGDPSDFNINIEGHGSADVQLKLGK